MGKSVELPRFLQACHSSQVSTCSPTWKFPQTPCFGFLRRLHYRGTIDWTTDCWGLIQPPASPPFWGVWGAAWQIPAVYRRGWSFCWLVPILRCVPKVISLTYQKTPLSLSSLEIPRVLGVLCQKQNFSPETEFLAYKNSFFFPNQILGFQILKWSSIRDDQGCPFLLANYNHAPFSCRTSPHLPATLLHQFNTVILAASTRPAFPTGRQRQKQNLRVFHSKHWWALIIFSSLLHLRSWKAVFWSSRAIPNE